MAHTKHIAQPDPATKLEKRIVLGIILVPALVPPLGLLWLMEQFDYRPNWHVWRLLVYGYYFCMFGISLAYHRELSHKAIRLALPVRFLLMAAGTASLQGPPRQWADTHLNGHHAHAEQIGDPHSPFFHTLPKEHWIRNTVAVMLQWARYRGIARGKWVVAVKQWLMFVHAHVGWLFERTFKRELRAPFKDDRLARFFDRTFPLWVGLGLLVPFLLGAWHVSYWSWTDALAGLLLGGFLRIFLLNQVTYTVNSGCHLWGYRVFATKDNSRNIWWLFWLSPEFLHNGHHGIMQSIHHGMTRLEKCIDLTFHLALLLRFFRLASNLKIYSPDQIRERQEFLLEKNSGRLEYLYP